MICIYKIGLDKTCFKDTNYYKIYGMHFSEKLCNYAITLMDHSNKPSNISKEYIDNLLIKYNIILLRKFYWDYIYVANMAYKDFYLSSIIDELHLALYIKDYIDDADGYDELPFARWKADIKNKLIDINFDEMI